MGGFITALVCLLTRPLAFLEIQAVDRVEWRELEVGQIAIELYAKTPHR